MDERPFPHTPLPQPPPSRRGFLLTGVLTALAAGGGVWVALSADGSNSHAAPPAALRDLRAAAAAEQALIDQVDAAARHVQGARGDALRLLRADHVAHLTAIRASIADLVYPAKPAGTTPAPRPATARVSVAEVRDRERAAAKAAADRAARLTGDAAALLASIAAAEAAHAELLR